MYPISEIELALDELKAKIRAVIAWFWEWVTVLTGIVTGAFAFIPDILNVVGVVEFTSFGISAVTAAKITSIVAVVKGLYALWSSRKVDA